VGSLRLGVEWNILLIFAGKYPFMKKIILFLLVSVAVSSCVKLGDINVKDASIENVSIKTMSDIRLDLVLKIDNANKKKIVIDDVELDIWMGGTYLGLIELTGKTTLMPQFSGKVAIPLQMTIRNLNALTALGRNVDSMFDKFEVTGFVKVKAGAFTRKHKVTKTTIKNLLHSL
jgi:LEA14-like dessication related protein